MTIKGAAIDFGAPYNVVDRGRGIGELRKRQIGRLQEFFVAGPLLQPLQFGRPAFNRGPKRRAVGGTRIHHDRYAFHIAHYPITLPEREIMPAQPCAQRYGSAQARPCRTG